MKLRYLGIILLSAAVLFVARAATAAAEEAVTSFAQSAVLSPAGGLSVSDEIYYDFGLPTPHDISFTLPLTYHDDQGREFRMAFHLVSALQDGSSISLVPDVTLATVRITLPAPKIGSVSHYTLRYTLAPVVLRGLAADILKLSVTGLSWSVPINQATMRLETPAEPADNVTCFTGAQGSTTGRCTVEQQGKVTTVTSYAPLQPGETLSILSDYPYKSFTTYLESYEKQRTTPVALITLAIFALGLFIAAIIGFSLIRNRPRNG